MKSLMAALLLAGFVGNAYGAAFLADQRVYTGGATPTPVAPPAIVYDGGLPADGRYAAAIDYVGQAGGFTARGASAINVDLRTGTFNLSNNAIDSCYRSPVCNSSVLVAVYAPSSFQYSDTLSVWAPNATAANPAFVQFVFTERGLMQFNIAVIAGSSESIVSSLSLVDENDPSIAASASINRLCTGNAGCTMPTTTTATFDPSNGTFAAAVAPYGPQATASAMDSLLVRIPVFQAFSVLDLSLAMALVTDSTQGVFSSNLTLVDSPDVTVRGANGYLLQPLAVPEPDLPVLLLVGMFALWYVSHRRTRPSQDPSTWSNAC